MYQLMHFTRAREKRKNLEVTVSIQGNVTGTQPSSRVLGIYFAPNSRGVPTYKGSRQIEYPIANTNQADSTDKGTNIL